jgi:hypothetical protein
MEYILGGGSKVKKSTTKVSKVPKVPKVPKVKIVKPIKSKIPKIKPVKVIPISFFGTTYTKSNFKIKPLTRAPANHNLSKTYRGAEDKKLKKFAKERGQLTPKVLEDREQCDIALGHIDCNGKNLCYICLSKLIPHTNVFNHCKSIPGHITAWNLLTLPILDENAGYYPHCEHVIACKTASDDLNPWYMNFMMYKIHVKLLDAAGITAEPNIPSIIHTKPVITTDLTYLYYFLRIIIRMNYEWSHAVCNILKSNIEFAKYNAPKYEINSFNIYHVLNMLYYKDKSYYYDIEVDLGNHLIENTFTSPYNIHRDKLTSTHFNKQPIIDASYKSIENRVNFILDQLTYSRSLNLSGKGYSKFNHTKIAFSHLTQGGSNEQQFINIINSKIDEINKTHNNNNIKNFETNVNLNEINIDFNDITIPTNDDDFINFIKNIHKTIFIEMLKKEANKDIKKFEKIITSLNIFIFTDNILEYFIELISNFDIDDYFFQEVILVFNNEIDNIKNNIKNLYDYIMLYKKNKLVKNANIYDEIKKIENTKSYDLLIQLINLILYNPNKDFYIKKYEKECNDKITSLNEEQLKLDYLKFLTLNNPGIQKKYENLLSDIYDKTPKETIIQHLFIINFFQKILSNIIKINIETEFYNICYIYFKLCINYGHLDKTDLHYRLNDIKIIDSFLKKIDNKPEINKTDLNLLEKSVNYLSTIKESSQQIY